MIHFNITFDKEPMVLPSASNSPMESVFMRLHDSEFFRMNDKIAYENSEKNLIYLESQDFLKNDAQAFAKKFGTNLRVIPKSSSRSSSPTNSSVPSLKKSSSFSLDGMRIPSPLSTLMESPRFRSRSSSPNLVNETE